MRVAAVATASGLPSAGPASTKVMPHFTRVFESAAITMAMTATCASPLWANSDIDSVMASTSVRPASAATA